MKNNQKGFVGIAILIIVILGGLGFGAYKVLHKDSVSVSQTQNIPTNNSSTDEQTSAPSNTQAPSTSANTNSTATQNTANWKLYSRDSFSIQYPNSYQVKSQDLANPPYDTEVSLFTPSPGSSDQSFTVFAIKKTPDTLDSLINTLTKIPNAIVDNSFLKIDGANTTKISISQKTGEVTTTSTQIVFQKGTVIYKIVGTGNSSDPIFVQFYSSFKSK